MQRFKARMLMQHLEFQCLVGRGKRIWSSRLYQEVENSLNYRCIIKRQNKTKIQNIKEQAKQGSQIAAKDSKSCVYAEKWQCF